MCGIIMACNTGKNKATVNESVLGQFEDQKERGTNGFGIVKINDKMEYQVDRATEGYKFMWDIHANLCRGMLMHHRIPTSSENKIKQTHPISVDNGSLKFKYLTVHNGVIQNDFELKAEHEALGFVYTTQDELKFNDSEALAIEMARFIEGQIDRVGTRGNVAFVSLQISRKTNKITKVFFGRNEGNPLNMAKTRNKLFISSTGPGDEVKPFIIYSCKLDDEMKLNRRKMEFAKELPAISYYPVQSKLPSAFDNMDSKKWKDYEKYHKTENTMEDNSVIAEWRNKNITGNETEEEELEPSELDKAVQEGYEIMQAEIDEFTQMLDDEHYISYLGEKDIEYSINTIRTTMQDMLKKVQDNNLQKAMEKEEFSINDTIGFKTA